MYYQFPSIYFQLGFSLFSQHLKFFFSHPLHDLFILFVRDLAAPQRNRNQQENDYDGNNSIHSFGFELLHHLQSIDNSVKYITKITEGHLILLLLFWILFIGFVFCCLSYFQGKSGISIENIMSLKFSKQIDSVF